MNKGQPPKRTREEVIEFVKSLPDEELEFMLMMKEIYPFAKAMTKKTKDETSASIA